MRVRLTVVAGALVLAPWIASAEPRDEKDLFMSAPPTETVYATEHHMGFSMRASIIEWLGGVPIVDDHDLRAAHREKWWGQGVPLLPPGALQTTQ